MELKQAKHHGVQLQFLGFNRTFMELKLHLEKLFEAETNRF